MILQGINWLAVIVAGAIYFGLGAVWYSPLLFSNLFMKYRGMTREQMQTEGGRPLDYGLGFIVDLIAALALAVIVKAVGAATLGDGLLLGVIVALGFVAPSVLMYTIFSGPHRALWAIYTGYQLVGFAVMGVLLALWK